MQSKDLATSYSGKVSDGGNVMVEIHRKDGPKLSLRERLAYEVNWFLGR